MSLLSWLSIAVVIGFGEHFRGHCLDGGWKWSLSWWSIALFIIFLAHSDLIVIVGLGGGHCLGGAWKWSGLRVTWWSLSLWNL